MREGVRRNAAPEAARGAPDKSHEADTAVGAAVQLSEGGGVGDHSLHAMMAAGGNLAVHRVQMRGGGGEADVHAAASHGISGAGGALPHAAAIQRSFGGHDVSGVQGHVGGKAAEASAAMGAEAYATGNAVAFASAPDVHTAAHEAAHVVQQRAGVSLAGGVGKAGDAHERHADAVADKVVKGESAEGLLGQYSGGGGGGGVQQSVQRVASSGPVLDPAPDSGPSDPSPPPADPRIAELQAKVDADKSTIKGAATLEAYASAVGSATALVREESKTKVRTRISRLMNSYNRALPVWSRLPAVGGKSAVDAYWTERMAVVNTHLPAEIAKLVDPAATALSGKAEAEPASQMAAERALNGVIAASGYTLNAPETQADAATVDEAGGIVKCFDVGDLFWKMNAGLRAEWANAVAGGDQSAAQALFIAQCKAERALPVAPTGKAGEPPWSRMTHAELYTGGLTGFVGMGRDAGAVASFADAMRIFALNGAWYPSGAMFIVTADAAAVQAQLDLGALRLGKPSIFCHLEFEEFLYAEHDQQFGELARMTPDGRSATETFNGIKEMSCVGYPAQIWQGARFAQ